jgi:precorrin-6A/cobalt-precorrin-6A reductase
MLRLLILGGTGEARALAQAALRHRAGRLHVVSALPARPESPTLPPGDIRRGGFGGAEGLARFLAAHRIAALIDATHPFAQKMAANARLAAEQAGVPRLKLIRPMWPRAPEDQWIEAADLAAAATLLPGLARRVWLDLDPALEMDALDAFADLDLWFLVRAATPPTRRLRLRHREIVLTPRRITITGEQALIRRHAVEAVVARASGGITPHAKIVAARRAGLPVVLVRRPAPEPGEVALDVAGALAWLDRTLAF